MATEPNPFMQTIGRETGRTPRRDARNLLIGLAASLMADAAFAAFLAESDPDNENPPRRLYPEDALDQAVSMLTPDNRTIGGAAYAYYKFLDSRPTEVYDRLIRDITEAARVEGNARRLAYQEERRKAQAATPT